MATQARSIASLTISFGLVAIPVKLYSATQSSERISFNLLRAKDGSRVKQQYVAVADGQLVERAEMVKGYEFAKDQYVMFSPEELKALEDTTTHAIDIGQFVPLESVDPVYFDGTYYLAPDKGGAKPYTLLATALRKTGQCAVGRWVSRGKEHIVIIRPMQDGLAMHQLHFKEQVRELKDLGLEPAPVSEPELKLAQQLIDHLAAKRFDANEYHDEFKGRVEAAIQKKVEGKQISLAEAPAASTSGNVIDLMEALRASIDARGAKTPSLKERKAPKRATGTHRAPARRLADEMQEFDSKDLKRLFGIPASHVRSLIRAGHISPSKKAGKSGKLAYSFQDLIVLRTLGSLRAAKIPTKRINRTLREIRSSLPGELPLSGLSIVAVGDRIVVREGRSLRESETGQYTLALEVIDQDGALLDDRQALERRGKGRAARSAAAPAAGRRGAFRARDGSRGTDAEGAAPMRRASRLAAHGGAGESGTAAAPEGPSARGGSVYRGIDTAEALLSFNLAVLLEDLDRRRSDGGVPGRPRAGPGACRRPLQPRAALRAGGQREDALRHLLAYRRS